MAAGHNSFEDVPWINTLVDFTAKILSQDRIRLVGVCFGHQIIGRAMGVKVGRNDGLWEAAVDHVDLSERGKQVFGKDKLVIWPNSVLRTLWDFRSDLLHSLYIRCIVTSCTTTRMV